MELSILLFALIALAGMAGVGTRGKKVLKKRRVNLEIRQAEIDREALAIKESIEDLKKI